MTHERRTEKNRAAKRARAVLIFGAVLLTFNAPSLATSVERLDLAGLTERAATIVRGEVVGATAIDVAVGGGQLPAIEYRVEVEEMFKGEAAQGPAARRYATFRVVGSMKSGASPALAALWRDVPKFRRGDQVLLFLTAESSVGLSSPVGLAQGAFRVELDPESRQESAANGFANEGLWEGVTRGPLPYGALRDQLRARLQGGAQ